MLNVGDETYVRLFAIRLFDPELDLECVTYSLKGREKTRPRVFDFLLAIVASKVGRISCRVTALVIRVLSSVG